jgi:hypothetical protein
MESGHPVKSVLALVIVFLFLVGFNAVTALDKMKVPYPFGYRDWTRVKSIVSRGGHALLDQIGGAHHLYVNSKGLWSYRHGMPFPDGSVIVFDFFEENPKRVSYAEGQGKEIWVMQKDSRRFKGTGGWGFEAFEQDTRSPSAMAGGKRCFDCHSGQKQRDYVFTMIPPSEGAAS